MTECYSSLNVFELSELRAIQYFIKKNFKEIKIS